MESNVRSQYCSSLGTMPFIHMRPNVYLCTLICLQSIRGFNRLPIYTDSVALLYIYRYIYNKATECFMYAADKMFQLYLLIHNTHKASWNCKLFELLFNGNIGLHKLNTLGSEENFMHLWMFVQHYYIINCSIVFVQIVR